MNREFVVIEFNQASHAPRVYDDTVHDDLEWARQVRDNAQADTDRAGRREEYRIYELTEVEDDE